MRQFFREHTEVSFVLLLTVKDIEPFARQKRTLRIKAEFYSAGEGSKILRLRHTLTDAVAKLPNPVLDPLNAYFQCREPGYGLGHFGGHQLSRNFVKISARAVLELLAGRITASEINRANDWRPGRETKVPSAVSSEVE